MLTHDCDLSTCKVHRGGAPIRVTESHPPSRQKEPRTDYRLPTPDDRPVLMSGIFVENDDRIVPYVAPALHSPEPQEIGSLARLLPIILPIDEWDGMPILPEPEFAHQWAEKRHSDAAPARGAAGPPTFSGASVDMLLRSKGGRDTWEYPVQMLYPKVAKVGLV